MTTLPIHTVQHVKSVYNKYQVIAIVCTAATFLAALLAAVSGFQLAKLNKMQAVEVQTPSAPAEGPVPAPVDSGLKKQIKSLESQLQSEKTTSHALRAKVHDLEEKLAALKVATPTPVRPAPVKPKPPEKPIAPEVAPATGTTPPAQPAGDDKTVAAPLENDRPGVPEPAETPAPATEKEPSMPESAAPAAPGPSSQGTPRQAVPDDGAPQTAPSRAGDTTDTPVDSSAQPTVDSKPESQSE